MLRHASTRKEESFPANTQLFVKAPSYDKVKLLFEELTPGYRYFLGEAYDAIAYECLISMLPSLCSGIWLSLSEQLLSASYPPVGGLFLGAHFLMGAASQGIFAKEYIKWSILTHAAPLSTSKTIHQRILNITRGDEPKIKLSYSDIEISGHSREANEGSSTAQNTLSQIDAMPGIVLPNWVLTEETKICVKKNSLPTAFFALVSVLLHEPITYSWLLEMSPLYLESLLDSFANYVNAYKSSAIRKSQPTQKIAGDQKVQPTIGALIKGQFLYEGAMSFLKASSWGSQRAVEARIGLWGNISLHEQKPQERSTVRTMFKVK